MALAVAIELLRGPFASTHGFAAMWIVSAGAILASIPVLDELSAAAGGHRRALAGPRAARELTQLTRR